jgi:hypothetical protein
LFDAPVAVVGTDGRVEVYASGRDSVFMWSEAQPGLPPRPVDLMVPGPTGPVSLVRAADRRLAIVTRQRETRAVVSYSRNAADGSQWPAKPERLSGAEGHGPIAAAAHRDGLVFAQLGDHGRICVARRPNGSEEPVRWRAIGPYAVSAPSVAALADGRVMIATIGADGKLFTAIRSF